MSINSSPAICLHDTETNSIYIFSFACFDSSMWNHFIHKHLLNFHFKNCVYMCTNVCTCLHMLMCVCLCECKCVCAKGYLWASALLPPRLRHSFLFPDVYSGRHLGSLLSASYSCSECWNNRCELWHSASPGSGELLFLR